MAAANAQPQSPSLRRLYHVEKRIINAVELAGAVMEELANASGPRKDVVTTQCYEFMKSIKDIQTVLHEEIKSMCEYRPYENCGYLPRMGAEISVKKLDSVLGQVEKMQEIAKQYNVPASSSH